MAGTLSQIKKSILTGKKNLPLKTKEKPSKTEESLNNEKNEVIFELEEARYLLSLIAKSDFSGKDVQIVYNIAVKLQDIIKNNLNEDNG
jgi:hypothetical protein